MCLVFWDRKRILLEEFLPQGSTIDAGIYCNTLNKLRRAIQNKQRGMLSRGVVMLHDTAAATQDLIATFGWEQFDHPPYSPDVAPADFRVLLHLKTFLGGGSATMTARSKKPLTHDLHCSWHHSTMQGYKKCCPTMTSASTVVETMLKSSV
jgi:hypothetical protein